MSEKRKDIPKGELTDEALDEVSGGKEPDGQQVSYFGDKRRCCRCKAELPLLWTGKFCPDCFNTHNA